MARLKGVIFGVDNVVIQEGSANWDVGVLAEIKRLICFLKDRGIEVALISNHRWSAKSHEDGTRRPMKDVLEEEWDMPLNWFIGGDDVAWKQRAQALADVRSKMGWQVNETFFVGNSETDMQSAINGGTLLLNAVWYRQIMDYGFVFDRPKEVARFIDVFCLREHPWFFQIEDEGLRVYALAPYGTMYEQYKNYSEYFIQAVKNRRGNGHDFWAKYLCTSMYFSGIYNDINYICPYPGHLVNSVPPVLQEPIDRFGKCFRARYLRDPLVRHSDAIESKRNRATVDHMNQLNTIQLTKLPLKNQAERYKSSPLGAGKTVLVVDDILTEGYSFEAARLLIRHTKANVVCVGLLKSLNRDYHALVGGRLPGKPFDRHTFTTAGRVHRYGYNQHIIDRQAPFELDAKLDEYRDWDWPS